MPQRSLLVELHDLSPSRLAAARALLAELDRIRARPRILYVIPFEPGAAPEAWAELAGLLRAEQRAGSEIVLHGWSHAAGGPLRGRWLTVARARAFAGEAAEFMSIDRREAARRLLAGRRRLREAGLEAGGFCAPGWLAQSWLPGLLAELGFSHYIGMLALTDLRRGRTTWVPWSGQIGEGAVQETLVRLGGAAMRAAGARRSAVKVFLHPAPALGAPAIGRTLTLIEELSRTRRPVTYRSLLA